MEQSLTFEQLPHAVSSLAQEVGELKKLLIEKQNQVSSNQVEKLLSVQEAAKFLNLTVPTIYTKVSKREIPFMKRGKRLYFSSLELLEYLKKGRKSTLQEAREKAEEYISKTKG